MLKTLSCLCLLIVLYSCKNGSPGSPKKAVADFIEASRKGDITEIKKYITRSDAGLLEMGENFIASMDPDRAKEMKDKMSKQFKDKTKDAKIEIKDELVDGDNATVNVEFILDGKPETRPFSLVKEDGQWKISLLSTGMKNAGSNQQDTREAIKNLDMDSLQGAIGKGMEEFNKMNKDSLKKVIEQGMKDVEKLKKIPKDKN
ncbi:MAG: DUF4878 domain-containing protein [Ferruginibacter sp.]|nr:DUF4878 domain-containing protein [Ferruginibacter sp.]